MSEHTLPSMLNSEFVEQISARLRSSIAELMPDEMLQRITGR